jgi:hypothetical protein
MSMDKKSALRASVAVCIVGGVMTVACGSQQAPPAAPSTATPGSSAPPELTSLTGTWSGSGADSYSPERVKWVLAQSGSNVTGTAELTPMDPADGSCASCHKLRKGTVSGTLNGATLTLRMNFPAGGDVPTPVCVTDLTGTASLTGNQLAGIYSGTDSCEGLFANGQLSLTKQ